MAQALLKIGFFVFEAFAGAAAAATLGAGAAVAIGAAVVVGGTLVAKHAMSLFEVEMPTVDTDASRQRTVRSTTEPQKIIYGEALVSGPISFIGLSGTDNSDLYQTIVLAGHELNDITDIHMDDVVITDSQINGGSDAGGNVTAGKFGPKGSPSTTICVIKKHLGEASQTADVLLTGPFANYTSAHRGDGIAYLAMKWVLNDDSAETWDKFAPSNVRALVKGKSVYDPRTDTTVYSDNPALCLADYLTDTILGMGIPTSKIDWDAVEIAAEGCDASVPVPGGTEKRFTCNGVVFATDSHQKNINKILSSMNGNLVYSNGKYIVHAGIYEDETIQEPFETLNEDDLIGAISIKTSLERSDRFNTIKGLFIDPAQNHKSSEFPKVQLADAVTRDNNEILEKEVQYPMTNSSYMAQRLSHKLIKLSDQQKVISFPANLAALRITAGDRVKVSIEELSWSNKVFQCVGWTFSEEGGVNLTLREDSESAYDDPTVTPDNEYSTITATGDITDAFRGVPSPSGLTVTPGLKSNELNWVNPGKTNDFGTIYVYASRNANFSSAIKIGETDGTQFIHDGSNKSLIFFPSVVNVGDTYTIRTLGNTDFTAMGAASNTVGVVFTATATGSGTGNLWETIAPGNLRYYWVRAVKNVGTDDASRSGLEPPNDPNTTVFATVGAVEVDWDNVADPTIGIDINNDTISINTGVANTTTGQDVATSGIEAGTTVTQGGITMNQGGSIKGGQSAYNSGTGFFLGYDTNAYKFSIGNSNTEALTFDGTNLAVTGAITATSGSIGNSVTVGGTAASTVASEAAAGNQAADQISLLPRADDSEWTVGTGAKGIWSLNGETSENAVVVENGPHGELERIWKATSTDGSGPDGGFQNTSTANQFPIVSDTTYRFSVFIKQDNTNGSIYLGAYNFGGGSTLSLYRYDGTGGTTNKYWFVDDLPTQGEWYLLVGFINPSNTNSNSGKGGVYNLATGVKVASFDDLRFSGDGSETDATTFAVRTYNYYAAATPTSIVRWAHPRVDRLDRRAPSIAELLRGWTSLAEPINAGVTITGGGITMSGGGSIKGGQTAFNDGTGFFLGYDAASPAGYKLSVGNAGTNSLTFEDGALSVSGSITANSLTVDEANITGTLTLGGGVLQDGSGNNLTTTTTLNANQIMSEVTGVVSQAQHAIPSFYRITTNDALAPSNSEFNAAAGRLPKVNDIVITTDTTVTNPVTPNRTYGWTCTVAGTASTEATWGAISDFISGDLLVDGTVTADQIAANAVTAGKINVTNLEAIQSNLGNITAGTLKGGGATAPPDANAAPSGTESGSFFDLDDGKFVVGDASRSLLFDGSNLTMTGDVRVKGTVEADTLIVNNSFQFVGKEFFIAAGVEAGGITADMLSGSAINLLQGSLAQSVGGSNGDFKEGTGTFTTSGGSIVLGTSGDLFDHGELGIDLEANFSISWNSTTEYSTDTLTLQFQVSTDGTNYTNIGTAHSVTIAKYDLSQYYPGDYYVYFSYTDITETISAGSLTNNTDYYIRALISSVPDSVTGQTPSFTFSANEGVTGVTSTGGNADTLDNLDSTAFLRSNVDDTFDANLTVTGNLTVNGTTTTVNTDNLTVKDNNITLNYSTGDSSSTANNSGITIQDAVNSTTDASILWKAASDTFEFSHGLTSSGAISATSFELSGISVIDSSQNINAASISTDAITSAGDITLTSTTTSSPSVNFNSSTATDPSVDMAIKLVGEELHFYEPEDTNKVHFKIYDDTGVDAPFGYWVNGTRMADANRNLTVGTISSGNLTVGTISSGVITAGASTTQGTSIIEGSYSDGTLVVFGGRYSSGGPFIGYGVRPSTTDTNKFHSSTGVALNRSAYILDSKHAWYLGSSQTVAIGSDVTISKYMELTTSGLDVSTGITTAGTISIDQNSVASGAWSLEITNSEGPAYTADALTAYNAHTSWDMADKTTLAISSRPDNSGIYTYMSSAASTAIGSSVQLDRTVQLNHLATNIDGMKQWVFYQYDGSGTSANDFKIPNGDLFNIIYYDGSLGNVDVLKLQHDRLSLFTDITATVINTGDATLLTLHHDTGADLSQQKSFIDFSFEDDNTNETPQVRIGAEVGQNGNADSQIKEGSGAFVVYTNNATTASGAATGLNERFRVDYTGDTWIKTGVLKMGTTTVIDAARNITANTITATRNGTALTVNSGTTNVTATFESGDATAWINLKDSNSSTYGTLLGAEGGLFRIRTNNNDEDTDLTVDTAGNLSVSGAITSTGNLTLNNTNISGVNAFSFYDPGPNEGISWTNGNTAIFESPDDLITNTAGNLQFVYGTTRRLTVNSSGIDVNGTIASGAITATGDSSVGASGNISMSAGSAGQFQVLGSGYTGAIALDANAMHIYHNSSVRNLILGTNETARLTIGGTGGFNFNSNNLTSIGTISSGAITARADGGALKVYSATTQAGARVEFSDLLPDETQKGYLTYYHVNTGSYGSGNAFVFDDTEDSLSVFVDGKILSKDGYYVGPATGTGAGTQVIDSSRNLTNIGTISVGQTSNSLGASFEALGTDAKVQVHYLSNSRGGIAAFSTQRIALYTTSSFDDIVFGYSTDATAASFVQKMKLDNGTGELTVSGAITSSGPITVNNVNDTYNFKAVAGDTDSWFGVYDDANNSANIIVTRSDGATSFLHLGHSGATTINGTLSSGAITSGTISTGSGTAGALALTDLYSPSTGDHLANIGWLRSSGGTYLSYGAKQSGSATWVSTFDNFSGQRNYVAFNNDSVTMVFAPAQQTAVGSAITGLTERFKFDLAGGNFQVGGTTVIDGSRNATFADVDVSGDIVMSGASNYLVIQNSAETNAGIVFNDLQAGAWPAASSQQFRMQFTSGAGNNFTMGHESNYSAFTFARTGIFTAVGNITAYSDERLKENIQTLDGSKVLQMRGVSFTKDGESGSGVIAQELEKIAPELVHDGEYKSVAYGNLVGYLIESAKQQQSEIDELKALVKQLMEK